MWTVLITLILIVELLIIGYFSVYQMQGKNKTELTNKQLDYIPLILLAVVMTLFLALMIFNVEDHYTQFLMVIAIAIAVIIALYYIRLRDQDYVELRNDIRKNPQLVNETTKLTDSQMDTQIASIMATNAQIKNTNNNRYATLQIDEGVQVQ